MFIIFFYTMAPWRVHGVMRYDVNSTAALLYSVSPWYIRKCGTPHINATNKLYVCVTFLDLDVHIMEAES